MHAKAFPALCFCLGLFIAFFNTNTCKAQTLTRLQDDFNLYNENSFKEKIFVHTDKDHYTTGELLWFKTYCVESILNTPTTISKVAYVELLDASHTAVLQAKLDLTGGNGNGSFYLPAALKNGNYQLRAYTSWMKNFGPAYFFEKNILIINPSKVLSPEGPKSETAYDIQFFPEGGHLVQGLASKVACELVDDAGKGTEATGIILNQTNDTISKFKTQKFGIGSFSFTPKANSVYKAVVMVNGKSITKNLPAVEQSGYVMQVTPAESSWHVTVRSANQNDESKIYLLVHNSQTVEIAREFTLKSGSLSFDFDKGNLVDGPSYITIFDEQRTPITERAIFKKPTKRLTINTKITEKAYSTRKLVSIPFVATNQTTSGVSANLSVAVFKNELFQADGSFHIGGYLLLNAMLKGQIESPDYYLENNDSESNTALDNLLLTRGWTQFDWTKIVSQKKPEFKFIPEYTGHIITASLTNSLTKKPAADVKAFLSIPGEKSQFYTSKSDSAGMVLFNTHDAFAQSEIIMQTDFQTDSIYHFELNSPFSNQYSSSPIPAITLTADLKDKIVNESINAQVQNIFSGKQTKQFFFVQKDTLPFYQYANKSYLLDNYVRFTTMEEVLREYVSSIVIAKRDGKFNIKMFDKETPLKTQPLVLLDGLPLFDVDKIFYIDPLKVKKLDVVTKSYLYGPILFDGILSFSTYNGDLNGFEINPHAVVMDYEGLQAERKFYSPVYQNDQQTNSTIPDFRNTLYWNPNLTTNSNGEGFFNFYTGDRLGHYTAIIEGATINGELGYQTVDFEVK